MTDITTDSNVRRSLHMFTGSYEMGMHSISDPKIDELTRGRVCYNCHMLFVQCVVIPCKTQILVLCRACIQRFAVEGEMSGPVSGSGPMEEMPPASNIEMAISTLSGILEDTSA